MGQIGSDLEAVLVGVRMLWGSLGKAPERDALLQMFRNNVLFKESDTIENSFFSVCFLVIKVCFLLSLLPRLTK